MASQWHYRRGDDETVGPVGAEELKSLVRAGELGADDFVWREDMPDWVAVGRIKQLKDLIPGNGQPPTVAPPPALAAVRTAASPPAPPAAGPDLSPGPSGYQKIGGRFAIAGSRYFGEVIASDAALYFALREERRDAALGARGQVGFIGRAVISAIAGIGEHTVGSLDVVTRAELPPAVREHPTWPIKDRVGIVVVPKSMVAEPGIVHPKWGNLLKLRVGDTPVVIEYHLFNGGRVRSVLEGAGWPLAWGVSLPSDPTTARNKRVLLVAAASIALVVLAALGAVLYVTRGPSKDLLDAASEGDVETIRGHVAAGRDLNPPRSALYAAAARGKTEAVRALLEGGADPSRANDKPPSTPAHAAAAGGHVDALRLLVEKGANLSATDDSGRTPLLVAVEVDQVECVRVLVERGADVSVKDLRGQTPLHLAARHGSGPAVALLLQKGAAVDPVTDEHRETPLMMAAQMRSAGCRDVAKLLLARGASRTARDAGQRTAEMIARSAANRAPGMTKEIEEMIALLLVPEAGGQKR